VILDELLSRRLLILSGKGGVGKSVVGMALAIAATRRGKRVLLVEIDSPRVAEASRYLGAAPVGATETEILPGLSTVNLDPADVMEEYVRSKVPLDLLVRKIVESPVYYRFLAAAPGLKELMVLGKIMVMEEAREGWSRRPRYDLIVVDAPATGHGLAFLKVPQAASAAVPVGPVGSNARKILSLLRDPKRTALAIVAIPEEMAVVEAREFHEMAVETGMHPRALILNGCHEPRFTPAQEAEIRRLLAEDVEGKLPSGASLGSALEAARRHLRRRKMTRFYQQRLRKSLPLPVISLPHLFVDEMSPQAIALLADRLEAA
jgi:anion-transporting  ArsA/GET3 family ATPase